MRVWQARRRRSGEPPSSPAGAQSYKFCANSADDYDDTAMNLPKQFVLN